MTEDGSEWKTGIEKFEFHFMRKGISLCDVFKVLTRGLGEVMNLSKNLTLDRAKHKEECSKAFL